MEHIKTHKIRPIKLNPGDTLTLSYRYEEPESGVQHKELHLDTVTEPMLIDTVLVYRTEKGEFGLKAGRAIIMGERDE